jgi:hypothetical protein
LFDRHCDLPLGSIADQGDDYCDFRDRDSRREGRGQTGGER